MPIALSRGPASPNPRMLLENEHHLVNEALYIISYEKRFETQEVEQTRYFVKDPGLVDWLEVPAQLFDAENRRHEFTHGDTYVKFICDHHPGYLFICRTLVRCNHFENFPLNVKYTRRPRDTDKNEEGDGEYKMESF